MSDTAVPIVVLHDDGALVAVVKPPGEPVIAARGEPASDCLQKRLERQLGRRIYVGHRIDRTRPASCCSPSTRPPSKSASL